jgi:uncharacterized protein (TIGR02217 family)
MFLEERLPIAIRQGANYADRFGVENAIDPRNGYSYSRLRVANPARELNAIYTQATDDLWDGVLDLYHRAYGSLAGFRVRFIDDYSSNGNTGTPTAVDQVLDYVASGVYQLQKKYGTGATALSIGYPVRTIKKPVSGTVKIAIDSVVQASGWTVDTTTGLVTFSSPPSTEAVVTGGFEFDVPCRFSDKFDINQVAFGMRETGQIQLVELLNP